MNVLKKISSTLVNLKVKNSLHLNTKIVIFSYHYFQVVILLYKKITSYQEYYFLFLMSFNFLVF